MYLELTTAHWQLHHYQSLLTESSLARAHITKRKPKDQVFTAASPATHHGPRRHHICLVAECSQICGEGFGAESLWNPSGTAKNV